VSVVDCAAGLSPIVVLFGLVGFKTRVPFVVAIFGVVLVLLFS